MRGMRELAIGAVCALALGPVGVSAPAAAADIGLAGLIAAYNGTGQQLFQAFAKKPANIVLSPYSVGTAMAMAWVGARGENAAEMAKVLGLADTPEAVAAANAEALASLKAASSQTSQLFVANALMLTQQGGAVTDDYVAVLRDKFAAEVFRGADLERVNDWVKQKTQGKIDSILDRLNPQTLLVVLDAIYFKAAWQTAFDAKATDDQPFHLLDGEANVPTMHLHSDFALAVRSGYRAIRLPYAGERVGMVVVLPDAGVADVVQRLDGDEMRSLLGALRAPARSVELSIPRFKASFKADLIEQFTALGMHRAFDFQTADFSGMTGKPQSQLPLAIDQIAHRAVIDVAEEGTEAAAASGVSVAVRAVRAPTPEVFSVDRPFLFAIVDDETGAILFEGQIVDPRQAS